jgi:hypothetical protein
MRLHARVRSLTRLDRNGFWCGPELTEVNYADFAGLIKLLSSLLNGTWLGHSIDAANQFFSGVQRLTIVKVNEKLRC